MEFDCISHSFNQQIKTHLRDLCPPSLSKGNLLQRIPQLQAFPMKLATFLSPKIHPSFPIKLSLIIVNWVLCSEIEQFPEKFSYFLYSKIFITKLYHNWNKEALL